MKLLITSSFLDTATLIAEFGIFKNSSSEDKLVYGLNNSEYGSFCRIIYADSQKEDQREQSEFRLRLLSQQQKSEITKINFFNTDINNL